MLYRRRTNILKSFLSLKNSITIFFVVLIILIGTANPSAITRPFQIVAFSFSLVKNNLENGVKNIFSLFASKERLAEENRNLNNKYAMLSTFCASSIQSLKNSQSELEESLGRKNASLKNYLGTAYVIAKPPITPYGTVTIDLGSASSVKIGNQAIVGEYLVGFVSEVLNDRSTVKLYGEKDENTPILVGRNRLLLSGQGGGLGTFKARVANESKILVGENAWLSNVPNYPFGIVASINQSSADQYQDLTIKNPVNIFELSSVDIVSN